MKWELVWVVWGMLYFWAVLWALERGTNNTATLLHYTILLPPAICTIGALSIIPIGVVYVCIIWPIMELFK